MHAPMLVDRSARRDARLVWGGNRTLTALKRAAHRRDRRAARRALHVGAEPAPARRVTGWDVA